MSKGDPTSSRKRKYSAFRMRRRPITLSQTLARPIITTSHAKAVVNIVNRDRAAGSATIERALTTLDSQASPSEDCR